MSSAPAGTTTPALDPQRWKALAFIGIAQLMVVLDATIVNIALPQAQADLQFSDANRQWVITAYSLAFGGLLSPAAASVTCGDASASSSPA